MGLLCVATWVNDVDLCCDLVTRPEPRRGDQRNEIVFVIVNECFWVAQRELFLNIPDTVVRTRLGVVIAFCLASRVLLVDDLPKYF